MKVGVIAPFDRSRPFGGSQRATAIAERLEDFGIEIRSWTTIGPRDDRRLVERIRGIVGPLPSLVAYHGASADFKPPADVDAMLVAHSYMWPFVEQLPCPCIADLHNLEWVHLNDIASMSVGARAIHLKRQARLMHNFEADVVSTAELVLCVTGAEQEWAERHGAVSPLVVPNVLPRAAVSEARRLAASTKGSGNGVKKRVTYVGQLRYTPNAQALSAFLETTWPALRASQEGLTLSIVGECPASLAVSLSHVAGVEVLGYVEDLADVFRQSHAALLPIRSRTGSSLRVLFYALAGIPMIGSPDAFRGYPEGLGTIVGSPEEWVYGLSGLRDINARQASAERAEALAKAIQSDPSPWEHLSARVRGSVSSAP